MKNNLAIALAFVLMISGCSQCNREKTTDNGKLSATLKLNWIYTGSFAGEVLGMKEYAQKNGLDLKIQPGGQGLDPIKLVGENEFGTAAADEIISANDKGAEIVIIGVINYNSPACFISKAETNITKPQDLIGKKVGLLPFGSTGLVYKSLLKKNNIDESKITEITVSPDLKVFLTTNNHDVQPAFIYDETVSLDEQGIKYNVLVPKDWGVNFKGPCYFTKRSTIEKNPELAQAFINTMADGWSTAIANPEKAIQALKEVASGINSNRELKVLQKGIEFYKGYDNKPLASDVDSWSEMITELKGFSVIKNDVDSNKVINFSFINNYYQKQ